MAEDSEAPPRLRGRLLASRLALLVERLTAALWLPLSLIALALALALSDLLPRLPGWLHLGLLVLASLSVLAALIAGLRDFRWPREDEARHRLETDAPHRPLSGLDDHMAQTEGVGPDPLSAALWRVHARRMAEAARHLRVRWPDPVVPRHDPWGLRVAAALALILAGAGAWPDPVGRLTRAVTPVLGGTARPLAVDVWVTPPAYTGRPPLYRSTAAPEDAAARPIKAPVGSTLLVLIHGGDAPKVSVGGHVETPKTLDDGTYRLESPLASTGPNARLTVEDGWSTAASWPLEVVADRPPTVAFAEALGAAGRWRLRVPLTAADDYGVSAAVFHMVLDGAPEDAAETVALPLPGTASERTSVVAAPLLDLTAHRWAGLPVTAWVTVTDAQGQTGRTGSRTVTLPERTFEHPVARRIAALRRQLVNHPGGAGAVAVGLRALTRVPDAYDGDMVVFLGLTLAARRLDGAFGAARHLDDASEAGQREIVDLLWHLALRVEDGDLSDADRALAEAQKALEEALARNAPAADIQDKVEALRRAMNRYLRAMLQQMPELADVALPAPPQGAMSAQDLHAMLDRLGDLGSLGARAAAEATMERLRHMLDALRNARPMPAQAMRQMREMARRLSDLAKAQEELLDRTFRDHRDAFRDRPGPRRPRPSYLPPLPGLRPPPPNDPLSDDPYFTDAPGSAPAADPDGAGARLAAEQDALRTRLTRLLQDLEERMGAPAPSNLESAAGRMREAAGALAGASWVPATEAQGQALQALRDGQSQAMQRLMRAMGAGLSLIPGSGGRGRTSDPLGRTPGGVEADGVTIPTDASASRSRDILMELRRRSNDRDRPRDERDYIKRLLDRF